MTSATLRGRKAGLNGTDSVDQAFLVPLLGLALVLLLRCWRGLDVTDEMQYYGEILGLVESGRLFSSDLFVQQLVYLLFYPLFKLHHLLMGDEALVIFGRVVLAAMLLGLYVGVRKELLNLGAARWPAGLAAFAVTFAVPFHGIFALSYNTVSQFGWVLFILWCMAPARVPAWRWVTLLVVVGFAHPVAAVAMVGVLSVLLWIQRDEVEWRRWILAALCGLAFSLALLFCFTTWDDLRRALVFSGGFGVGGGSLWLQKASAYSVLLYVSTTLALAWWLPRMPKRGVWAVGLLLIVFMLWVGRRLVRETWSYGYSVPIAQCAGVIALSGVLLAGMRPVASVSALRALLLVSLVHFMVLVGTSSNGLAQGLGALMVLAPLACALVATPGVDSRPGWAIATSCMVLLLALVHWSKAPYRDWPWFRLDRSLDAVAAFRHIKVSRPNAELIDAYRTAVGPALAGRKALIASERPGLYFALGVRPQTCMLYMHSAGGQASAKALSLCLDGLRPDVILEVREPGAPPDSPLQRIIQAQIERLAMTCQQGQVQNHWVHAQPNSPEVVYRLCTAVEPAK